MVFITVLIRIMKNYRISWILIPIGLYVLKIVAILSRCLNHNIFGKQLEVSLPHIIYHPK